jgi:hypothetical protein
MAHRTVNSHSPVRTGQSGVPLKFIFRTLRSRVSAQGKGLPRANLAPLDRWRTGQSGALKLETLVSVFFYFSNRFLF